MKQHTKQKLIHALCKLLGLEILVFLGRDKECNSCGIFCAGIKIEKDRKAIIGFINKVGRGEIN